MKLIFEHWITTLIGVALMLLAIYMFYQEKPLAYAVVVFALGFRAIWAKDDLLKKLPKKF